MVRVKEVGIASRNGVQGRRENEKVSKLSFQDLGGKDVRMKSCRGLAAVA